MNKILLATTNLNKVHELKKLLLPLNYDVVSYSDFNLNPCVVENGNTFKENAFLKASFAYSLTHIPTLADDSGICIKHFLDLPGIYSARFLSDLNNEEKNTFIINALENVKNRQAKYICALAFIDETGSRYFEGEVLGEIAFKSIGNNGFGYDPIFYLPSLQKTFSQLSLVEKNLISHRGKALRKLVAYLEKKKNVNY